MVFFTEFKKEGVKLLFDSFKHLATLCTGSIVLSVAFFKNSDTVPSFPSLAVTSLSLFFVSILSSMLILFLLAKIMGEEGLHGDITKKVFMVSAFISCLSFLFAILILIIFVSLNLS
jgi:di/tricarboxylate transporter